MRMKRRLVSSIAMVPVLEAEARVAGPSGKEQMTARIVLAKAEVGRELDQQPTDSKRVTFLRMRLQQLTADLKNLE
jgi:hypothetical protein